MPRRRRRSTRAQAFHRRGMRRWNSYQGSVSHGVDTGRGGDLIVKKIPMTPLTPFREGSGKVVKRPGGPYAASFEESNDKSSVKWNAKQMGGEQREAPRISPEMQQQIDELRRLMRR